jgi:hypothetical protein
VFLHKPEGSVEAATLATAADPKAGKRAFKNLRVALAKGTRIDFHLSLEDLIVVHPEQWIVWNGQTIAAEFGVPVSPYIAPGERTAALDISIDEKPHGTIYFTIEVVKAVPPQGDDTLGPIGDEVSVFRNAFLSYATEDIETVLGYVHMLHHTGIDYFHDMLSIAPGERWERKLYERIDSCDVFYLFWSPHALASEWVLKEVRYARRVRDNLKGHRPRLVPMVVCDPPPPLPPDDLRDLQFNDWFAYFVKGVREARKGQNATTPTGSAGSTAEPGKP